MKSNFFEWFCLVGKAIVSIIIAAVVVVAVWFVTSIRFVVNF